MSTRVFNPVVMSEMRSRLRGRLSENGSQNSVSSSSLNISSLDRVRRDLFGPVNHEDSRAFVERELADQQRRDADHWGFDFVRGRPRKTGPGSARYAWTKVTPSERVSESYGLIRTPYLSTFTDISTEENEAERESQVIPSSSSEIVPAAVGIINKQTLITDYLKTRKRPCSDNIAKVPSMSLPSSEPSRPPKQARTSS